MGYINSMIRTSGKKPLGGTNVTTQVDLATQVITNIALDMGTVFVPQNNQVIPNYTEA